MCALLVALGVFLGGGLGATSAAASSYSSAVLADGPLAYYRLDESAGSVMASQVGSGTNGTYIGSPTFGQAGPLVGDTDTAVALNGANSSPDAGSTPAGAVPRQDFSLEFWVKTSDARHGNPGSQWFNGRGLVDGEVVGITSDYGVSLLDGKVAFGVGSPDTTLLSNAAVNDGNWHYVVATRSNSSGAMSIYIDGVLDNSASGPTGARAAPDRLVIGAISNSPNSRLDGVAGTIDEVASYAKVLTPQDVARHYNVATSTSGGPPPTKRASGVSVRCDYQFATSSDVCTAVVTDIGPAPSVTPTGTVKFASASGGSFVRGNICTLVTSLPGPPPVVASGGSALCQVAYVPPAHGGFPLVTATYSGDDKHKGSGRDTKFIRVSSGDTTDRPAGTLRDGFPAAIDITATVPTPDTTVQACAAPTRKTATAFHKAGQFITFNSGLFTLNQDARATATPTVTPASQDRANQDVSQFTTQFEADQLSIAKQQLANDLFSRMTKEVDNCRQALSGNTKKVRVARAKKPKFVPPLAQLVRHHRPAGRVTLKLRLNQKLLDRLAGKRNKLTILLRLNMTLPSATYKSGIPQGAVKVITIKRKRRKH